MIAIFTKYDQFKREIRMKLEDQRRDPATELDAEVESVFDQYFLASLTGPPPFIRLESKGFDDHRSLYTYHTKSSPAGMHRPGQQCNGLIKMTANALSGDVAGLMLLAVQRDNLELSINQAITKYVCIYMNETRMRVAQYHYSTQSALEQGHGNTEEVMKACIYGFPSLWVSGNTMFWVASC